MEAATTTPPGRASALSKLLAAVAVVVVLGGGFYVVGNLAEGKTALYLAIAFLALATIAFALFAWRLRPLRVTVLVALAATLTAGGLLGYLASRPSEVNEQIVTGVPATASPGAQSQRSPRKPAGNVQLVTGSFSGQSGHSGSGKAAVVRLPSGERKLTFSRFDVDPGAGRLRVELVPGTPRSDDEVREVKRVASLKGTRGNQQYTIPAGIDLRRYRTVVIWCAPFSTRIAQASLGGAGAS